MLFINKGEKIVFASELIYCKEKFKHIIDTAKYIPKTQDLIDYELSDAESVKCRLLDVYERSKVTYAVMLDGKLFGVVGIKEYAPRIGNIYFNSIDIPKEKAIGFIKEGKKILNIEKENYCLIYNRIMIVNDISEVRWVELMGFKLFVDDVYELPDGRRYIGYAWKKYADGSNQIFSEMYKNMIEN